MYSIQRRLQEVERVDYRDTMCDCVFDDIQASELSIALRVSQRVDFEPLPAVEVQPTAAEFAEPKDQLSSASPDYLGKSTIAQSSFAYTSSTYIRALPSAPVYRPHRMRQRAFVDLASIDQSRASNDRLSPLAMSAPSASLLSRDIFRRVYSRIG